ncbi:MAG TPA: cobalamin-dependent protein [Candidatus Thermoplasmatota archaeon]|nr:cobalamin-dependent protein [Candidatus Thermoplasmatota archaeon]
MASDRVNELVDLLVAADDPLQARDEVVALLSRYPDHETFYAEVLRPVLVEVGERWARNQITVAEEHRATHQVKEILSYLKHRRELEGDSLPRTRARAVVACVAGEAHDIGARMIADALDARGWRVTYLGASTPARDLVAYLRRREADAVFLSFTTILHLGAVRETVEALRALREGGPRPVICVGGRPLVLDPDLPGRLGADVELPDLQEALSEVERRLGAAAREVPRSRPA